MNPQLTDKGLQIQDSIGVSSSDFSNKTLKYFEVYNIYAPDYERDYSFAGIVLFIDSYYVRISNTIANYQGLGNTVKFYSSVDYVDAGMGVLRIC